MPSDLFGDLTNRPSSVRPRRRTGVVVAIAGHAAVILGVLSYSLTAPGFLPAPRTAIAFIDPAIRAQLTDVALPSPPHHVARRADEVATMTVNAAPGDAPPVVAQHGIAPDTSEGTAPVARSSDLSSIEGGPGTANVGFSVTQVQKPAPPATAAAVRLHSGIQTPEKIVHVDPVYPALALRTHVQGVVILEAIIDGTGRVDAVQVLRSIPLLDQAAVNAVRQWRYRPALLNGSPLPVIMTITVNFQL
jgi:protein TonB